MSLNFVETIKEYYSPDYNGHVAKSLNESQSGISNALSAIIATGLDSILNIATSGKEGANIIFDMAKSGADHLPESPDAENLHKEKETHKFISGIFGNNQSSIIDSISKFAGIQNASTSTLMALAIPAIMRFLGKHADQNDLSASGLSGFLSSQYNNISQALPANLSALDIKPDIESLNALKPDAVAVRTPNVTKTIDEMKNLTGMGNGESERKMKWLLPLISIIIVIAIIWYFIKG